MGDNDYHKYVFIDFETTGKDHIKDFPIEIGCREVIMPGWIERSSWKSEIHPPSTAEMDPAAKRIHGYSLEDLADSPSPKEVCDEFFTLFGTNFEFAGWNVGFDIAFFRKMCAMANQTHIFNQIPYRSLDVRAVARAAADAGIIEPITGLTSAMKIFELKRSKQHDALEDAEMTYKVYHRLIEKFEGKGAYQGDLLEERKEKALVVITDGASRGNNISEVPSRAAVGFVAIQEGTVQKEYAKVVGDKTNNEAEYLAILVALKWLLQDGRTKQAITLKSDAQVVVRQINGEYSCNKEHLQILLKRVNSLKSNFSNLKIEFVPREETIGADNLANRALDEEQ